MLYTINYLAGRLNRTPQTIRKKLKQVGIVNHTRSGEKISLNEEEVRRFLFMCYKRQYNAWVKNGDFEQSATPIPMGKGYIQKQCINDKHYYYIRGLALRYLDNGEVEYYRGGSFPTQESAEMYRDELVSRRDNGDFLLTTMNKSQDAVSYFKQLLELKKTSLKESTYSLYETFFNSYFATFFENVQLGQINRMLLEQFLKHTGYNKTVYVLLKLFLEAMFLDEITNKNFYLLLPKKKHHKTKEKHVPSQEELDRYFKYIEGMHFEHVVRLMFFTGLRVGEAMALTWDDVFFDSDCSGHVIVNKTQSRKKGGAYDETPKTESSNRTAYFHDKRLVNILKQKKSEAKTNYLCEKNGRRWKSYNKLNKDYFNDISTKLGFKDKMSSHYARTTYISYMSEQGIKDDYIKQQVGHKNTQMINTVYKKSVVSPKEAVNNIDLYNVHQ